MSMKATREAVVGDKTYRLHRETRSIDGSVDLEMMGIYDEEGLVAGLTAYKQPDDLLSDLEEDDVDLETDLEGYTLEEFRKNWSQPGTLADGPDQKNYDPMLSDELDDLF